MQKMCESDAEIYSCYELKILTTHTERAFAMFELQCLRLNVQTM